jgi:hypothetical protein
MVSHYLQFTPEMQRSISMILVLGSWVSLPRLGIASGLLLKSVFAICKFELFVCYVFSPYPRFRDINYMCVYHIIFFGIYKVNIITVEVVRHLRSMWFRPNDSERSTGRDCSLLLNPTTTLITLSQGRPPVYCLLYIHPRSHFDSVQ